MEAWFPRGVVQYLQGGCLIGSGVALLYLVTGRQGGASTLFSAVWTYVMRLPAAVQPALVASRQWRLCYALGMVLAGAILLAAGAAPAPTALPEWRLLLGGLLAGFGARLGGGCTSGHGICGMASLSAGSLCMVGIFLIAGMATAHLVALAGG